MSLPHLFLLCFACLSLGYSFVAVKIGVAQFPPIFFTALRYVILLLFLIPLLRWYNGQMLRIFGVTLFMGAVNFMLFYSAIAITNNVSSVAVVVQMGIPFATLLSVVLLNEHVSWWRWGGIFLGFGGVAIISFDATMMAQRWAIVLALGAGFCYALGMVLQKGLRDVPPMPLQAWVALVSSVMLLPVSLLFESGHVVSLSQADWVAWMMLLYTALVAGLFGQVVLYAMIQRYDVSLVTPITLLAPVFGVMFSITFLDDPISWRFLLGGSLALIGVLIVVLRTRPQVLAQGSASDP